MLEVTLQPRYAFFLSLVVSGLLLVVNPVAAQNSSGRIIFADDFGRLLLINADGTGQTALTPGGSIRDSNPVYSPDGSKIACDRSTSTGQIIVVMNADGMNPVTIVSATDSSSQNKTSDLVTRW
jgi:Tol biopolymer transport system component